ncbi:hypothetical protein AC1031_010019 [Aphanomyces cochlioides]|nr:hypothetical protein AC1031_010019 [Aphanomyces cochlioides]
MAQAAASSSSAALKAASLSASTNSSNASITVATTIAPATSAAQTPSATTTKAPTTAPTTTATSLPTTLAATPTTQPPTTTIAPSTTIASSTIASPASTNVAQTTTTAPSPTTRATTTATTSLPITTSAAPPSTLAPTTSTAPSTSAAPSTTVSTSVPETTASNSVNVACLSDTYKCRNGQFVGRDPLNDCKFYPCRDSTEGPPHPATTLAPNTKNTSAVVRFSMATTSSAFNWTSIDEAIPLPVVDSVHESFRRYNVSNVCDNLGVAITSAERAIVNDTLKQNTSLYHVLVDVNCTLQGVNQTTGMYVLEFVSAQPIIRLTQCGVIENGTLRNWLAVHNHATMCQTPPERRAFLVQPLEHTMHFTENKTASSMMSDLAAILEKPTVWHLFAAAVAVVVLLAFVFAVVVGRRRIEEQKRRQMERSILEEVATGRIEQRAREAAAAAAAKRKRELGELEDEPSPRDNPLDTEKALKEHDARKDVFTIEDEDD